MSRSRKYKQLSDIANIRTGYTFREKIHEVDNGNAHIVQIKDARKAFEQTGDVKLLPFSLPMINWTGSKKIFADSESVILPVRGEYSLAFFIQTDSIDDKPIIVSSQFLILTPKNNSIHPAYLCWALNQSFAQNYLKQESQGTSMSMLSITSVSSLKLPVPAIEIQDRIIQLNQLWQEEQKLIKRMLGNRERMLAGIFQQLLNGKN